MSSLTNPKQRYYYSLLSENDKKIYDDIVSAWRDLNRNVKIPNSPSCGISTMLEYIRYDIPKLFYVDFNGISYRNHFNSVTLNTRFHYTDSEIANLKKQLNKAIKSFTCNILNEKMSPFERELSAHDFLASTVKYDFQSKNDFENASIVAPLLKNRGICEGYAKAFKLLCDEIGVSSLVAFGTAVNSLNYVKTGTGEYEGHAWNIVKIGGKCAHVDVTWDSVNPLQNNSKIRYDYFNLADDEISKDHVWDKNKYPKCDTHNMSYYHVNDYYITSKGDFEKYIINQIKNKVASFNVKFSFEFEDNKEITRYISKAMSKYPLILKTWSYSLGVSYNKAMRTALITIE
ncbi:MAG: hypothetical protein FWG90_08405 [Oscillospiraceae bacterium]|nr:hypothetical protein [Oscillospiraceae bacterium]